jgi:hypothetical protein
MSFNIPEWECYYTIKAARNNKTIKMNILKNPFKCPIDESYGAKAVAVGMQMVSCSLKAEKSWKCMLHTIEEWPVKAFLSRLKPHKCSLLVHRFSVCLELLLYLLGNL